MATSYDAAVEALYRGALDAFVAERKRLAQELKAGGDKDGAARLAKLGRPSISAWAVNQLFWHEREAFERLLATAARLKKGEHTVGAEHQRTLSALRALAATRLESGGHAAPESTLRRVTTTLSAIAASGSFEPDPPGALAGDRDPPGFEAISAGFEASAVRAVSSQKQERQRAAEERRRLEEERARQRAERERLEAALRAARNDVVARQRDVERSREELAAAESKLAKAESTLAELKNQLKSG
jgi:hypothetical protein